MMLIASKCCESWSELCKSVRWGWYCDVRTITGGGARSWRAASPPSISSSTPCTSTRRSSRLKDSSACSSTSDTRSSCVSSSSFSLVTSHSIYIHYFTSGKGSKYCDWVCLFGWGLLMWEIGRRLGHYGDHLRPQVADRAMPLRVDKRVAPDREGAADKQCKGERKLYHSMWSKTARKARGNHLGYFPRHNIH